MAGHAERSTEKKQSSRSKARGSNSPTEQSIVGTPEAEPSWTPWKDQALEAEPSWTAWKAVATPCGSLVEGRSACPQMIRMWPKCGIQKFAKKPPKNRPRAFQNLPWGVENPSKIEPGASKIEAGTLQDTVLERHFV